MKISNNGNEDGLKNIFEIRLTFNLADLMGMPLNDEQRAIVARLASDYIGSELNMSRIREYIEHYWK